MKITLVLLALLSQSVFAATTPNCQSDYYEMQAQIANYGSITSPIDHQQFTDVAQPVTRDDVCYATGFKNQQKFCVLKWRKGYWGYTFRCDL